MTPTDADVTIAGNGHNVVRARYEIGHSKIFEDNIVRLYIDFDKNGGIIAEMSGELLGQQVPVERGGRFCFFSIGDGTGPFLSFQNTKTDFKGYTGWFKVNLNEQTSECCLDFELIKNNVPCANGSIYDVFGRITPNA